MKCPRQSSLRPKAALDLNWDEPDERNLALGMVWDVLERVETQIQQQSPMTIR